MFSVVFFKTEAGNEPVLDWLRSVSREDRAILGADLRTIQMGFPPGHAAVPAAQGRFV